VYKKVNSRCMYYVSLLDRSSDRHCYFILILFLVFVIVFTVCKRWMILIENSWCRMTSLDLLQSTWSISAYPRINNRIIAKVLSKCGQFLTEIDFSNQKFCFNKCQMKTDCSCSNSMILNIITLNLVSQNLNLLIQNCKNIKKLSIGWLYNCEEELSNLFQSNKNLEYLAIYKSIFLGSSLLKIPYIHTIILEKCTVTYLSMVNIFKFFFLFLFLLLLLLLLICCIDT